MTERVVVQNRENVREATSLAADIMLGDIPIPEGQEPTFGSSEYMLERAALSSILIAGAVGRSVVEDDSALGYRFSGKIPKNISTQTELNRWIQRHNHRILDDLIKADPVLAAIAKRYQDLVIPDKSEPSKLKPQEIRRQVLQFEGAVVEADAWLRIASVAAAYHGIDFRSEHALPFVVSKLPTMQITARGDMALQNIRVAIREACDALGVLHNFSDPKDHKMRFETLRSYVQERTGHALPAQTFDELYEATEDPDIGIILTERPEGFGEVAPFRDAAYGCPASYHLKSGGTEGARASALNRLLRASITAMAEQNVFDESLGTSWGYVPDAVERLNANLIVAEHNNLTRPAFERTMRIMALAGIHETLRRTHTR